MLIVDVISGTTLNHIHWFLKAQPQRMVSYLAYVATKTTFQAGSHRAFSRSEISLIQFSFPLLSPASILPSRPFHISARTVLFIPLPVPCHWTPLKVSASSMAVRMIAKLVFVFINQLLYRKKKKESTNGRQYSHCIYGLFLFGICDPVSCLSLVFVVVCCIISGWYRFPMKSCKFQEVKVFTEIANNEGISYSKHGQKSFCALITLFTQSGELFFAVRNEVL